MAVVVAYQGRPLFFLVLVMLLWISGRVTVWLPRQEASALTGIWSAETRRHGTVHEWNPSTKAARYRDNAQAASTNSSARHPGLATIWHPAHPPVIWPSGWSPPTPPPPPLSAPFIAATLVSSTAAASKPPHAYAVTPPVAPYTAVTDKDRWSGSAWLLWRHDGTGPPLAAQGRLGGSQAGLRLDHSLETTAIGTFYGYSRLSAALERPHSGEAALGISLRPPLPLPVSLGIERRVRLSEGGRNAFALIATAGIGPHDLGSGLSMEGYAQGGIVGFHNSDGFADGRLSLTHSLLGQHIAAGLSVSGGAQPGLSRLDIGPVAEFRLPLGSVKSRLLVEWRERIRGSATPGSGLAITLASDF